MATIKIYDIYCYNAPDMSGQGQYYRLEPWGHNTLYYEGEDDGGRDYILPDGYKVVECVNNILRIFDASGDPVDLTAFDGNPALVTDDSIIKLAVA